MKKSPNAVDAQIGARVRMHRRILRMTQEDLGQALGLTFQQVQKYEKGINRIGAGRLQDIANILRVPVGTLFDAPSQPASLHVADAELLSFIGSGDGQALARSFSRIKDSRIRSRVVRLVEELAMTAGRATPGDHPTPRANDAGAANSIAIDGNAHRLSMQSAIPQ